MEDDCRPGFNFQRWSLNKAIQCDVYLRLFGERVGSPFRPYSPGTMSVTHEEEYQSRGEAAKSITYLLQRPFPDAELLYSSAEEKDEYYKCLKLNDTYHGADIHAWRLQQGSRTGINISSVAELRQRLDEDVRLTWW
jgi:hypothetical protein